MKIISGIIGILCVIAAVLGGLYVALYLCLFGGIVQVIEGAKATPINSVEIAIGLVKFFCSGLAGWATFMVGAFISSLFFAASAASSISRRGRHW